jgi:hypothetical protein
LFARSSTSCSTFTPTSTATKSSGSRS